MSSTQHPSGPVVDVRSSVARERHPLIFNTFHAFEPGQDFISSTTTIRSRFFINFKPSTETR